MFLIEQHWAPYRLSAYGDRKNHMMKTLDTEEMTEFRDTTPTEMWLRDLNALEAGLLLPAHSPNPNPNP